MSQNHLPADKTYVVIVEDAPRFSPPTLVELYQIQASSVDEACIPALRHAVCGLGPLAQVADGVYDRGRGDGIHVTIIDVAALPVKDWRQA